MSMKNSNDTIGNRNHHLLACSAVPQPTALPAACPHVITKDFQILPNSLFTNNTTYLTYLSYLSHNYITTNKQVNTGIWSWITPINFDMNLSNSNTYHILTLILLTWRIWWANNARWDLILCSKVNKMEYLLHAAQTSSLFPLLSKP
jgi:hypothetical protein